MSEVEFIIITASDIHISDNGPRSRVDDFKNSILQKIDQIGMVSRKLNADAVIIAGDLYNLKNPTRNSHNLNRELIQTFRNFSCPIYMIEGNHDLSENRLGSINTQPLGVLFADNTLIQLRHEILEKENIKISLVGIPYQEKIDPYTLKIPTKDNCVCQICAMHIYASLKSGYLFKERIYGYDELGILSPDIFILGHYHIYQGVHHENNKYFVNLGSVSRGAISEDDINHQPQIGLIKISVKDNKASYIVRSVRLKVKPASEVFDIIKKDQIQKENEEIKLFIERLAQESEKNNTDQTQSIDNLINTLDLAEAVRKKIYHFIQEAGR